MKSFIYLFIFPLFSIISTAQPGTLDENFGDRGKSLTSFGIRNSSYEASVLQQDGKILSAGSAFSSEGPFGIFFITRYLRNGSIDSSFGKNGQAITDLDESGFGSSAISCLAIQDDNKIIGAGYGFKEYFYDDEGAHPNWNLALARYLPDGLLDSAFGVNGKVMTDFGGYESAYAIIIQSDRKIVVAGSSEPLNATDSGIVNFLMARYLPDGTLDASFGDEGKVITDLDDNDRDIIRALALQSDGKIVAGGINIFVGDGNSGKFALARYDANGNLDALFGNKGIVLTDFGPNGDEITDIALQPDGKIVAAGNTNSFYGINPNMAVARYNADGSLDQNFGKAGKVNIQFEGRASKAESVILQPDGKIFIGGYINTLDIPADFALVRCEQDGSLDSIFGINGKVITDMGGEDYKTNCLLQEDGKIILAGYSNAAINYYALARYHGDPVENPVIAQLKTWLRNNTLGWYTSNNSSVNYYSIQRSISGSTFTEEKRVQAKNTPRLLQQANTREQQTFTYALNTAATNSYYRVAAILKDGSTAFSPVVYYGSGKNITLYPNPVKDVLMVKGLQPEVNNLITISDVGGNVLLSTTVHSSESFNYNVNRLKAGQYVLRVQSKEQVQSVRFVKE